MQDDIQSLMRSGRYPEAIKQADSLCSKNPSQPEPWLLKASIHAQAGDLSGVVSACEHALKLQPNNIPARYNLAVALQMLGRSQAAIENYLAILACAHQHAAALTNLGLLYRDTGQLEDSLRVLQMAIQQQPSSAPAYNALGLTYCDLGRYDDALEQFRIALNLRPDLLSASTNIARADWKRGDTEGAVAHLDSLLAQRPNLTEAHLLKAQILDDIGHHAEATHQLSQALAFASRDARLHYELAQRLARGGDSDKAVMHYKAAAESNPNDFQSLNNLGALLHSTGQTREGIEVLKKALRINPDSVQIHVNLCTLHAAYGNDTEAQKHCLSALRLQPGRRDILQRFAQIVGSCREFVPSTEFNQALLACFDDPGVDQQNLAPIVLTLIMSTPGIREFCSLCHLPHTPEYSEFSLLWRGSDAVLLERLLARAVIPSADFEFCLRAYRRAALCHFVTPDGHINNLPTDSELAQLLALAHQCFNNEFAYDASPAEEHRIHALEDDLCRREARNDPHRWMTHIILALYRPLRGMDAIFDIPVEPTGRAAHLHEGLLKKHIRNADRETQIKRELPQLTPITAGVSTAVRAQYEESPYPRWLSLDIQAPRHYRTFLRDTFPQFSPPDFATDRIETLIAGCGTGKHAILSATRFNDCVVTAIDLSRSSLAYAKRNAEELGIENIDFYCGDILKLGEINRSFHIIESVGVLHHLADPGLGLSTLRGLLKSRGLMNLGFYSTTARRAVHAARSQYSADEIPPDLDTIRRARKEILSLSPDDPIYSVTGILDFYSLSDCRDLLFHTQETCYTLPEIAGLLDRNRLDFIGFELPDARIRSCYLAEYPDDPRMTDLHNWDRFEQEHPDTFIGMYVFWCQARD